MAEGLSRRQVTIVFVDLAGSTQLSNKLALEGYFDLIRSYVDSAREVIESHNGTVRRVMGDGVLATFGVPAIEDSTEHAVEACLEIMEEMQVLNLKFESELSEPLRARVGVASGEVLEGFSFQGEKLEEHPLFGSTTILAQRLQSAAEPGTVLISEATRKIVKGAFECADLGTKVLKGFEESGETALWKVTSKKKIVSRFEKQNTQSSTPFVGRKQHLQSLQKVWTQVQKFGPEAVVITGEAGIGKSRLIAEFFKEDHYPAKLTLQCSPMHERSALYPVRQLILHHLNTGDGAGSDKDIDRLAKMIGENPEVLSNRLALIADFVFSDESIESQYLAELSPEEKRDALFSALSDLLVRLAVDKPLVILFEDIHWIDPSSWELVQQLGQNIRTHPVLFLLTTRSIDLRSDIDLKQLTLRYETVALEKLVDSDIAEMVRKLTTPKQNSGSLEALVNQHADGVPLFIEELITSLSRSQAQIGGDQFFEEAFTVPSTISDLLMAQLDALPVMSQKLASIAAAVGREVGLDVLQDISGLSDLEVDSAVTPLLETGLIKQTENQFGVVYRFKHALVRDAAYGALPRDNFRRSLHKSIADRIEKRSQQSEQSPPEVVAWHYTRAAEPELAVTYWKKAAIKAYTSSAPVEEKHHLEEAIKILSRDLTDSQDDLLEELDLLLRLGAVTAAQTSYADKELKNIYSKAIRISQKASANDELVDSLTGLAAYYYVKGELGVALDWAHKAHDVATMTGDEGRLIESHRLLGEILLYEGKYSWSRHHFERCIEMYDPEVHGDNAMNSGDDPAVLSHMYLAIALWFMGFPDQAVKRSKEGQHLAAQRAGDYHTLAQSQFYTAWLYALMRDVSNTEVYATVAVELCEKYGLEMFLGTSRVLLGWAQMMGGEEKAGIKLMEEAIDMLDGSDAGLTVGCFLPLLAEGHMQAGDLVSAKQTIDKACSPEFSLDRCLQGERKRVRTLIENLNGDVDLQETFSKLEELLRELKIQDAKSLEIRAMADWSNLLHEKGLYHESKTRLDSIVSGITEGFEVRDVKNLQRLQALADNNNLSVKQMH